MKEGMFIYMIECPYFSQAGSEADCFDRNLPRNHVHRGDSCLGTHLCSPRILKLSAGGVLHKVREIKNVWKIHRFA